MTNLKNLTLISLFLLAACAHTPQQQARQAVLPPDASKPQELPNIELTGEMLYGFLLGDIAVQRGQTDLAAQTYLELADTTRDIRIVRHAAHIAFETRQMDKALDASRLWQQLEPESILAKQMLVALLLNGDKLQEARPQLIDMLARDPNPDDTFMQVYPLLARLPDKAAAYDLLHELAVPYPQVAEAHWAQAQLAEASGRHEVALEESRLAYNLKPKWDRAVLLYAQLSQRDTPQRALDILKSYLDAYPDSKDLRLVYARMLMGQKQYSAARTEFKQLLDAYPDNADLAFAIALLSLEMGELDRAEQELQQALANGQKDQNTVYYYLGQLHEAKKQNEEALQDYSKVEEGEYVFPARLRVAYLLNKNGKLAEARATIQQTTVQNDQERVQLIVYEAQLLRSNKQQEAAYEVLTQGLKKLPDQPDLLYEAAMLSDQIGKHEIFESLIRKLIQAKPDYAHGYNALGYSLLERNERLSEGMQLVEKAYQLAPNDAAIIDSVGWGHYRLGNLPKSIEFLRRAYAANPDPEIAAHLGEVLWMQGAREEAKKIWQQALKEHADSAVLAAVIKKFLP